FKNQWQLKTVSQEQYLKAIEEKYKPILAGLQEEVIQSSLFEPKAVWGYWPCQSDGNDVILYDPDSLKEHGSVTPSSVGLGFSPGHERSERPGRDQSKRRPEQVLDSLKGHGFSRAEKDSKREAALAAEEGSVSGHDFSRAGADAKKQAALAAEGNPREIQRFTFPRQKEGRRLCISDFFAPRASGQMDVIGLSLVTVGDRASHETHQLFERGEYTRYLYLHGLSVETAEALAEYVHKRIREELGIANDDAERISDLFHQKYRGSRFSFGYPACPNLEDQT